MELANREELGYPPFGKLVRILFRSKSEEAAQRVAEQYGAALGKKAGGRIEVLGPVEAPMSRIKDYYRWHLLLRGKGSKRLRTLAMEVHRAGRADAKSRQVIVTIDVDPAGML